MFARAHGLQRDDRRFSSPAVSMFDFFGEGAEDLEDEGGEVLHTNNGLDRWVRLAMWTAVSVARSQCESGLLTSYFRPMLHQI